MKRSHSQAGQVLPLLTLVLAFIFAIGLSVTQSIFSTNNSLNAYEERFQDEYTSQLKIAYTLNAIVRNNRISANVISSVAQLFLDGTAQALDLAATVPIWEMQLPIPTPENVYASFDSGANLAKPLLESLHAQNTSLVAQLPKRIQTLLIQRSPIESICALGLGRSISSSGSSNNCSLLAKSSMVSAPQLRIIRDLSMLSSALGRVGGLVEIQAYQEIFLSIHTSGSSSNEIPNPFVGLRFALTHAAFCRDQFRKIKNAQCTNLYARQPSRIASTYPTSLEPKWSVRVHEIEDSLQ